MDATTEVAIVGAGPYGLSIAAYLRSKRVTFRIVGGVMASWRSNMPKGMLLKSPGCASDLYDPGGTFTLQRYCRDEGIPYDDVDVPVALSTFCAYGAAFQQRFVPEVEHDDVTALEPCPSGFDVRLKSGRSFRSAAVVLAVGLDHFRHVPGVLAELPSALVSHSGEHHDLQRFAGQDVAVIGGGASAIDIAVLLQESRANVQQIVRGPRLRFGKSDASRIPATWRRMRTCAAKIGGGPAAFVAAQVPGLFAHLPEHRRLNIVRTHLGPLGGWFMQQRAASVRVLLNHRLTGAAVSGGRVRLRVAAGDATERQVSVDHVIAATGFRPDARRLAFLSGSLSERLQLAEGYPRLSTCFESSVPGLYFVGPIAAATFGPVMRFAVGAEFTARRLSAHLAHRMASRPASLAAAPDRTPMAASR